MWTERRVLKTAQLVYGDLCDSTEYPDTSAPAINMAIGGMIVRNFFGVVVSLVGV